MSILEHVHILESFFSSTRSLDFDFHEIEHTVNYALASSEESLFLREKYNELISSIDLANYFNNFQDFMAFVRDYTPTSYKKSGMFIQSIEIFINYNKFKNDELSDKEEFYKLILGQSSLVKFSGMSYPDNTCPFIDDAIKSLEEEKKELEEEIELIEEKLNKIEEDQENKDLLEIDYKIDIEDIEEKIYKIDEDIDTSEKIRKSCEDMRSHMQNVSKLYKNGIELHELYFQGEYRILDIENFNSDIEISNLEELENYFNLNNDQVLDKALNNHELIRKTCEEFINKLEDIEDEIFYSDPRYINRKDFIQKMIKEVL